MEEAADFEKNLEDPQFREAFEFNKDLLDSMRIHYRSELKNKLKSLDDGMVPSIAKSTNKRFYMIGVAAAIVFIVASTLVFLFDQTDHQELFSEYYSPYYNVLDEAERSLDGEGEDLAMRLYDQRKYEEAITVFEEAIQNNPNSEALRFYQALSYLSIGQADSAIVQLSPIASASQARFREPARWYLGLAYLRRDDLKEAEAIFKSIVDDGDSYSDRAKEILEALD